MRNPLAAGRPRSIATLLLVFAILSPALVSIAAAETGETYLDARDQQYERQPAGGWWLIENGEAVFAVDPSIVTVRFLAGVPQLAQQQLLEELGLTVVRVNRLGFADIELTADADPVAAVQALAASGLVETAELNTFGAFLLVPNDPSFGQQWNLSQGNDADIDAPEAWDLETGSPDVVVAVLDSGTDFNQSDIGPGSDGYQNVWLNDGEDAWSDPTNPNTGNGADDDNNGVVDDWKGYDFNNDNNDSRGPFNHGTMVGGIVAAKTHNGDDIAGVAGGFGAPGSRIMIVQVGDGAPVTSILDESILYALDNGADIITMSLTVGQTSAIDAALQAAWDGGVYIDCASGNSGGPTISYPARDPNVAAIGSTDQNDFRSSFSSYGDQQEVSAPGSNITSTDSGSGTTSGSGTSFAAPAVAGVAALMKSINPSLTNQGIRDILKNTAEKVGGYNYNWNVSMPGHSRELGYGRVNAHLAVMEAGATAGVSLDAPVTTAAALRQNVPNPFNPATSIGFRTAAPGAVSLRIYTPDGRLVTTLVDEHLEAGEHAVRWAGLDANGSTVASGVYFYQLEAAGVQTSRKLLLSK